MSKITIDTTPLHAFHPTTLLSHPLPTPTIHLLDTFFSTVDSLPTHPENSQTFTKIFTPTGTWKTPSAAFVGHAALATSGTDWEFLRTLKFFRHYVDKVYALDESGRDLMVHGRIEAETVEGEKGEVVYGAKVDVEGEGMRLGFFQGWSSRV
ncbi:hypothetical protein M409DRAFT_20295 [Zasmidium cellare ATCC 36951]|uniref:SnoaL-like domain-containing protein n=1 Tax=Zasmidium cellare ATCC 36951 TaxID=1080233 RepID=A0A6A6CVP6_ZASCE|nr:uncharacterized protein M409DRAFT_20295 [Zasmidium cellare ATCC 36951]KAF2169882.1 hypothetical protein M409DRAFT_20295 [Zasmidium cellare ATCC 36951]